MDNYLYSLLLIPFVVIGLLGLVMFFGALIVGKLFRTQTYSPEKMIAYECGEIPQGQAWSRFNVRFYVTGLVFLIFDVEAVLLFPVAVAFQALMQEIGALILLEILSFLAVLGLGLAYCWRKGDLDWVRSFILSKES